jgi:hypothetical protein
VALSLVKELGCEDDPKVRNLLKAALLHDTLEDGPVESAELNRFGKEVVVLVRALTRRRGEERGAAGDQPDSPYLRRLRQAGQSAVVLKLADKIDNLRDSRFMEDAQRVQKYLVETYRAYLPLLDAIPGAGRRNRIERVCLEVLAAHPTRPRAEHLRALATHLDRRFTPQPTNPVPVDEIPDRLRAQSLACLFNPTLHAWIEDDGICLRRKAVTGNEMASTICGRLAADLESSRRQDLMELAGIPAAFASPQFDAAWRRVTRQYKQIHAWLSEGKRPRWFEELLSDNNLPCLLLLIQSRLFLPPSWTFPPWHPDFGVGLTAGLVEVYPAFAGQPGDTQQWHDILRFVLTNRLAIYRYLKGLGTPRRLEPVLALGQAGRLPGRTLWALRLCSEFLELTSHSESDSRAPLTFEAAETDFDQFWTAVAHEPFGLPALAPHRSPFLGLTRAAQAAAARAHIEWEGLIETHALFERKGSCAKFRCLLDAVTGAATKRPAGLHWIVFDHREWDKRSSSWSKPGAFQVDQHTKPAEFEAGGVRIVRERLGGIEIVRVLPARQFALLDRLPEMTSPERQAIGAAGFSAVSIFDALVLRRLDDPEVHAVWVPRMYRVLDSLQDLDPTRVQTITVEFLADEEIPPFTAFLPLPANAQESKQQPRRKAILARYVVAQVYNYAVARLVRKVTVSCSQVAAARPSAAFDQAELVQALAQAEEQCGYRKHYASYVDQYFFSPFGFTPQDSLAQPAPFTVQDMRWGCFLGIDIGGSFIKFCLFVNGQKPDSLEIQQIKTFEKSLEKPEDKMPVRDFCRRIIEQVTLGLLDGPKQWEQLDGVGISWPGAVRENHVAGSSGTLRNLTWDGKPFGIDDSVDRLPKFDFAREFRAVLDEFLKKHDLHPKPALTVALENDGNAEAFGNFCVRAMRGVGGPGGKVFLKLGTSLAGGRIDRGGVVAQDIGEYSKLTINLKASETEDVRRLAREKGPRGVARDHVSSLGVRNLTRIPLFLGSALAQALNCYPAQRDDKDGRIEPVELGRLLPIWLEYDPSRELLAEFAQNDNRTGGIAYRRVLKALQSRQGRRRLPVLARDYIQRCGGDLRKRHDNGTLRDTDGLNSQSPMGLPQDSAWVLGLKRTEWLLTGNVTVAPPVRPGFIPKGFPMAALPALVLASVAVFSELALSLAHAVASLYNVYRRNAFEEVILSGGVLSGETGKLVVRQADAFMRKYYDKIYGPYLPYGAIKLAGIACHAHSASHGVVDPEITGPLGAAMSANRGHKLASLRRLYAELEALVRQMRTGDELDPGQFLLARRHRACPESVRAYLDAMVADGLLTTRPCRPAVLTKAT